MKIITKQNELDDLMLEISGNTKIVSIDTEFGIINSDNYHPSVSLIQLCFTRNDKAEIAIIDAISNHINSWQSLKMMLTNPGITKIFQSSINDINVLYAAMAIEPVNIFDVQIAEGFLCRSNMPRGYAHLTKKYCNVEINKDAQYSNWLKRPLPDKLLKYAAQDVQYLEHIKSSMEESFSRLETYSYFQQDMQNIRHRSLNNAVFAYKKYATPADVALPAQARTRLATLYEYREKLASNLNIKADNIIPDSIIRVAANLKYLDAMQEISEHNPSFSDISTAISEESWDTPLEYFDEKALSSDIIKMQFISKEIREKINAISHETGISRFIIGTLNEFKLLAKLKFFNLNNHDLSLNITSGWRRELLRKFGLLDI